MNFAARPPSADDAFSLLNALHGHQIELASRQKELLQHFRRLQESHQESESLLENITKLLDASPFGYLTLSRDGTINSVNAAVARLIRIETSQLTKKSIYPHIKPDEVSSFKLFLNDLFGTSTNCSKDITFTTTDNRSRLIHIDAIACASKNECHAIIRPLPAHIESPEMATQLMPLDHLTGLPGRSALHTEFNEALLLADQDKENIAVIVLDLGHFKIINDTYGHQIADQLLRDVAERLKSVMRDGDAISRLGGDEFVFLLPGTNSVGAESVARKLIQMISSPYQIDLHEIECFPSVGIAIYPENGQDIDTLLQSADNAMSHAKQSGRSGFALFTQSMQVHSSRSLKLCNDLRNALAHNQMHLHYQPQLCMETTRLIGAEALLRWNHPEFGAISPVEFIPLAEKTGLIIPIGEWVIRTAATQLKTWFDEDFPSMVIAVNLSAVQFRNTNLVSMVADILKETGLPPDCLELELTEAVAMDDPEIAMSVMNRLHKLGILLSIDDFGTGYSSLSYLKKFNVHKLKIDRSFVQDISSDQEDKAIVTAIINMAHSLGMRTIAEGVENEEQLNVLGVQGCHAVQGFYFSKALPKAEFEAYVRRALRVIEWVNFMVFRAPGALT